MAVPILRFGGVYFLAHGTPSDSAMLAIEVSSNPREVQISRQPHKGTAGSAPPLDLQYDGAMVIRSCSWHVKDIFRESPQAQAD
jgi:hypothetical protein